MTAAAAVPAIDSHVHVWVNGSKSFPWAAEMVDPPKFDATPEMLLALMAANSVVGSVLVQYIGYRWDNEYTAHAMGLYPEKFVGVCRVNPEDPAGPDHLSYWTEERGFHGVRISPENDARGDWFKGPLMRPFFRRVADLKVPLLLLAKTERLPDLLKILDHTPDVDIVIDHLADCDLSNPTHKRLMATLADNPRVFLKTGHMWTNSKEKYPWRDQLAQLKELLEMYGASRIMWGSDWSFSLRHAPYPQALSFLRNEADFLTREELAWIMSGTTMRLWKFAEATQKAARGANLPVGVG